jgi:transcription antitermination protein NusB
MFDEEFTCLLPESRRDARETAMQLLYALELSGNSLANVLRDLLPEQKNPTPAVAFTRKLVQKAYNSREELDEYIKRYSANWKFSRIAIVDLIVMRIAVCEFLYFYDVPPKVTIDEAIELVKQYSTQKSSGYVNGILDAILLELKEQNKLPKTGRGMIEE